MRHIVWNELINNTTNGMIPKAVIKDSYGNISVFLKTDNYAVGSGFYGFSTLSERLGSLLGRYLNLIDVLDYNILYAR